MRRKKFSFDPKDDSRFPTPDEKEFLKSILELKDFNEVVDFFRDLLTITEIKEFANRWKIALLLYKGKSYLEIAQETKSSTTTVSRVAHWLFEGRNGYKAILDRRASKEIQKKNTSRKINRIIKKPHRLFQELNK